MAGRRYHHGDLRAALLTEAEATLRVSGVDGLSLRELARTAGVSHGAPRRHFEDKAALLEALVADGFDRLGRVLVTAAETDGRDLASTLKDIANAYISFASDNLALFELMSRTRYLADASGTLARAQEDTFAPVRNVVERCQSSGELAQGDVARIATVMLAMIHGLAAISNNQMMADALDDGLITEAVDALLTGLARA